LQLRATAALADGQSEKALKDVQLSLRLLAAIRVEPFLICHLVRLAQARMAIETIWEGLAAHKWSDAELLALEEGLAKADFLKDYHAAMRGERALSVWMVDCMRHSPNSVLPSGCNPAVPSGWWYQNQIN